jgi:hypothetical protein
MAANKTTVLMEGEAEIVIKIGRQKFTLTAWLSRQVKELLLGYNWLSSVECSWNFKDHTTRRKEPDELSRVILQRKDCRAASHAVYCTD